MINQYLAFAIAMFISLISFSVNAQTLDEQGCFKPTQNIITINGINKNKLNAEENLKALKTELSYDSRFVNLNNNSNVKFDFILNDTKNLEYDLYESARQVLAKYLADINSVIPIIPENFIRSVRTGLDNFAAMQLFANGEITYDQMTNGYAKPIADLQNKAIEIIVAQERDKVTQKLLPETANTISQIYGEKYATLIKKGETVILVPHSQGNLYASALYSAIVGKLNNKDEIKRLTVINVASPIGALPGQQGILQKSDLVISLIPGTSVTTMYPNATDFLPLTAIDNYTYFDDFFGHGFQEVYLSKRVKMNPQGQTLQAQLIDQLGVLLNNFKPNRFCTIFTPTSSSVAVGGTAQPLAVLQYNGAPLETQPTFLWASADTSIATVSATGVITGVAAGSAVITATDPNTGAFGKSTVTVTSGPFSFEVADIIPGNSTELTCHPLTVRPGDIQESYSKDECFSPKNAFIRCVGTGCGYDRFWVATIRNTVTYNFGCVFNGQAPCSPTTLVGDNYGVSPTESTSFSRNSYYWTRVGNNWVSPASRLDERIDRNIVLLNTVPAYYDFGTLLSYSQAITFNVYDTLESKYYQFSITVNIP